MDKITDFALTSHQGLNGYDKDKIYYLFECEQTVKDTVVDEHRFRIYKDGADYLIESIINESLGLSSPVEIVTSVCLNNNTEVVSAAGSVNTHTVNQKENSSFNYTFKRYYSDAKKNKGCQYESSIDVSFFDMFGVHQNQGEVIIFKKNAPSVDINISELNIEWFVNFNKIESLNNRPFVVFDEDSLRTYTAKNEAIVHVVIDGIKIELEERYLIDRTDYVISSVSQLDYINELNVMKRFTPYYSPQSLTNIVFYVEGIEIAADALYDPSLEGKDVSVVLYKKTSLKPISHFVVGRAGVVFIYTTTYNTEIASEPYLSQGYFELSSSDGSILGENKSAELAIDNVASSSDILNFETSVPRFFSGLKQMLFSSDIAPDNNGNITVKDEMGLGKSYRLEDIIDTEIVYEDKLENYVFNSQSSFVQNSSWDIRNSATLIFSIDSGRVIGAYIDMTYGDGVHDIHGARLGILWTQSIAGSFFKIYGIDADGVETLYVSILNINGFKSSISNARGTEIKNFDMYRYYEQIVFAENTKYFRIENNNPNIMFEDLSVSVKRS